MKKIIFILSLIVLSLLSSCKDKIINPPDDTPGRRDYVWTIDTVINDPWSTVYRLWAASPTDVWATGWGGGAANSIWHFNGNRWTNVDYSIYYSPDGIYGFGNDNIYIGFSMGGGGGVWHFDGNNFTQVYLLEMAPTTSLSFENIWGDSPYDFYAFGAYTDENGYFNCPVIARSVNGIWDTLDMSGIRGEVEHLYRNSSNGKIYLQVVRGDNVADSTTIYEFDDGKYYRLYGNYWAQGLQGDISLIDGEVYFVLGNKIAVRANNQFQTVITVDNPNFYQRIWGRNRNDIFLMMTDGLAHYNGTDIQYLLNYGAPSQIFGAALFENDIFFLVYKPQGGLSMVYHGKLK